MEPLTFIDPKQVGVLVDAFSNAFFGTPESADLVTRTRMTLDAMPDEVVRELGEVVDLLATLTKERLGE